MRAIGEREPLAASREPLGDDASAALREVLRVGGSTSAPVGFPITGIHSVTSLDDLFDPDD